MITMEDQGDYVVLATVGIIVGRALDASGLIIWCPASIWVGLV